MCAFMAAPELLILFVKDLYSESALETNRALIGAHTRVLSLQNGMGTEEILRKFVPGERVLLGTTKHNCVTKAPGEIYHSGAGITHIGSPAGSDAAAAPVVAAFAATGIETAYCPGVRHLLWEKLFVNMTINPVTALLDCPIGVIGENPHARALAAALIDEAVAVAAADGEMFDAAAIKESLWHTARALATGPPLCARIWSMGGARRLISSTAPWCGWGSGMGFPPPPIGRWCSSFT